MFSRFKLSLSPVNAFFSSGKETDTAHHNNLSPGTMEALQVLKFLFERRQKHGSLTLCNVAGD
ncbi:hypothetical protein HYDPIDRAFT_120350 [Hydnomerulius pinastri MD-312]|uniref:Uncharacterized protein n=1 Tax=Hydnomerulius pinastri MD-312 TaxID=994086 RepID=A0A0C9VWY0_9AGAM|nr:hypothetical protein HYDPIDRAFT_120350 [Hydnomerulius pinastri MD-312]